MTRLGILVPGQAAGRPKIKGKNVDHLQGAGIAIRAAFPLPKTGAFEDLLSALDAANPKT